MLTIALIGANLGWAGAIIALVAFFRERRHYAFCREKLEMACRNSKRRSDSLIKAWGEAEAASDTLHLARATVAELLLMVTRPRRPGEPIVAPMRYKLEELAGVLDVTFVPPEVEGGPLAGFEVPTTSQGEVEPSGQQAIEQPKADE